MASNLQSLKLFQLSQYCNGSNIFLHYNGQKIASVKFECFLGPLRMQKQRQKLSNHFPALGFFCLPVQDTQASSETNPSN